MSTSVGTSTSVGSVLFDFAAAGGAGAAAGGTGGAADEAEEEEEFQMAAQIDQKVAEQI